MPQSERRAGLAQLVEHLICNQGVGGSSPSTGTITRCTCKRDVRLAGRVAVAVGLGHPHLGPNLRRAEQLLRERARQTHAPVRRGASRQIARVQREFYPEPGPAVTAIRVAGFAFENLLIEIEAMAVTRD